MVFELVSRARTVRRFVEQEPVEPATLRSLVGLARLSPCSANRQTLKFAISATPAHNRTVFAHLAWAGYLSDWPGPAEGERPAAYILVLADQELGAPREVDAGLALQSMVLGAASLGLGTCILGNVRREELARALGLASRLRILYVLALGRPAEQVQIAPVTDGDIRYWRDDEGRMHVPKRAQDDLIVELD